MTDKKFYQNEEFLKLRNEWYKKLEKSGFEDLEWYNPDTGMGQGSPYLKSSTSHTLGSLRRNYASATQSHYRLCRNFLQHGGFYTILKENYHNDSVITTTYCNSNEYTNADGHSSPASALNSNYLDADDKDLDAASPASPASPAAQDDQDLQLPEIITKHTKIKDIYPSFRLYLATFDKYYSKADSVLWQMYCDGRTIREISKKLRKMYRAASIGNPAKRKSSNPFSVFWIKHRLDELKAESVLFNINHPEGLLQADEAGEAGEAL